MEKIDSAVCHIIRSELEDVGCELVDLEVARVRGKSIVRVYTDRRGGVTLKAIERAAGRIRDAFDRTDLLGTDYRLEVSSPGEKRSLRGENSPGDFLGRLAIVYLKDGSRRAGAIVEADSGSLELMTEERESFRFDRSLIEDMHLLYSCDE